MLLNVKVALIAGSAKGMGLAIAKEFAEHNGATAMICPMSDGRAKRVVLLNGKTDFANIDVTSDARIVKSMTRLLADH